MILAASILAGLALRLIARVPLSELGDVRLRGESILVGLLAVQTLLPLLQMGGAGGTILRWVWIATFPVLAAIALANRSQPGMWLVGTGLGLNFAVIVANGGMPVLPLAVQAVSPGTVLTISAHDVVHLVGSRATLLPWLADVIPVTGIGPLRTVVSAGDCLLFFGIAAFLALGRKRPGSSFALQE